jgi:hypothetical protein
MSLVPWNKSIPRDLFGQLWDLRLFDATIEHLEQRESQ